MKGAGPAAGIRNGANPFTFPVRTAKSRYSAEESIGIVDKISSSGMRSDRPARRKTSPVKGLDGDRKAAFMSPSLFGELEPLFSA
jgi:hypothetical protein